MKKVMFVAAIAVAFAMTGCAKKTDCTCTTTQTLPNGQSTSTENVYNDVEDGCESLESTKTLQMPEGEMVTTVECK